MDLFVILGIINWILICFFVDFMFLYYKIYLNLINMVYLNISIGCYKVIWKKVYILENVFRNVIMCVEKGDR